MNSRGSAFCHQQCSCVHTGKLGLQVQMVKDIQAKSRNLCHQQLGWFRDEQLFHWIDATQSIASIVEELTRRIECAEHEGDM